MGFLQRLWPESKRAKKNVIYKISDIAAFEKAADTVYQTAEDGKTSKLSFQDLKLANDDFITCLGDSNKGLPSFAITVGEAWPGVVINMSTSAHGEPSLYGLTKLSGSEVYKFTPRQRSLVR
jgi:hypothetical protein